MELKGADRWSYLHKIELVSFWKYPYDYYLTDKVYLSEVTVTNIYESFTHKLAAKTSWHRYVTKLRIINVHCVCVCVCVCGVVA